MTAGPLPTGTVTILFTDVEDSTARWERDETAMATTLAAHDAVLEEAVTEHDGHVFKRTGDGVAAVFTSARSATSAAAAAQQLLSLPVRMGLDTGEAELRDGDYYGRTVNRAARLMNAAHGGQIVLSSATAALVPDLELIDLGEHLLKGISVPSRLYQLGPGDFGSLDTLGPPGGGLPFELTGLVGREAELEEISSALVAHRVVTLLGVGGIGKTRLAMAAAAAALSGERSSGGGCRVADLTPVPVGGDVSLAFAAGLGYEAAREGDVLAALVRRLRDQRLLLVVDNCEHVREAVAAAVDGIVRRCPDVTILATSREPLVVTGERLIPIPPLPGHDARDLFVQRAAAEDPRLRFDDRQLSAIDELCARLDGVPLAIELAASRVRTFTPVDLLDSLDDRFGLLVGARGSRHPRHEALRNTVDWSYELCDATEQLVFRQLAMFQASFSASAAVAIAAGDGLDERRVLDALGRLIDRSLVQRIPGPGGRSRYRLLETMRVYGREQLDRSDETGVARERHATALAHIVSELALRTLGPQEQEARDEIAVLVPDCRVALEWFLEQRRWDAAARVVVFGVSDSARAEQELTDRLLAALAETGETSILLTDLRSTHQLLRISEREWNELALGQLQAGWRPPSDRFSYPPQYLLDSFRWSSTHSPEQIQVELVESLQALDEAPLPVRALVEWWVARMLAMAGATDLARARLAHVESAAEQLDSETVRSYVREIKGQIAQTDGRWDQAAHWFTVAMSDSMTDHPGPLDIIVAWHRLGALAISARPILGEDLRAPWRWLMDANLRTYQPLAALSTALALDRLGNRRLGQQFWWWARQNSLGGIAEMMARYPRERTDFGMVPDRRVELEPLIDELFAFADRMD